MDNKIKLFVSSPENQYLERKSARVEPFDILKHLVAFANADGGSLVIGVEDNREITGFNTYKAHKIEEFKNIALIKLKDTPIIPKYETFNVKNKMGEEDKILVISVEPTYDRGQRYFEDEVVEDTSIEDIDFELLESYRKNMDLTNSTLENILKSRNFIKKDF